MRELLRDMAGRLHRYRSQFIFASLVRMTGDVLWLFPAYAFAQIVTMITHYHPGQSVVPMAVVLGLWVVAVIGRNVCHYVGKRYGFWVAERVSVDCTLEAVTHLFRLDMGWHELENAGNKVKRIQNASDGFNRLIRIWFMNIIQIIVHLVAIQVVIAQFDHRIVACVVLFLMSYFALSLYLTRQASAAARVVNDYEEQLSGIVFESINTIRTVKAMGITSRFLDRLWNGSEAVLNRIAIRIYRYQSRNMVLAIWEGVARVAMVGWIIYGIFIGRYELAFLILFNSYFSDLRTAIDELSSVSMDVMVAQFSISRLRDLLRTPIVIENDTDKRAFPSQWQRLTLTHLSFAYAEVPVLHDISLTIHRGEKVGIVGLSGAGKSTLFKLLLKEREGFSGDIQFDDVSITDIKSSDYFNHVSVVLQDTEVFNVSLRDNIMIATSGDNSTDPSLDSVIDTANLRDLVAKLPDGLDTMIGEKGVKLSGGERQRLGIARAIARRPDIILMDEATSHLDVESEEKIQESLHRFLGGVTAIVIAHRLSTIAEMDRIVVLDGGRVIEIGSLHQLLERRGRFWEFWNLADKRGEAILPSESNPS
ncbi:ABC transporter ATP-binding protein [bacterium]|nr:ABC transporter ATP-binding protein [bacterium]